MGVTERRTLHGAGAARSPGASTRMVGDPRRGRGPAPGGLRARLGRARRATPTATTCAPGCTAPRATSPSTTCAGASVRDWVPFADETVGSTPDPDPGRAAGGARGARPAVPARAAAPAAALRGRAVAGRDRRPARHLRGRRPQARGARPRARWPRPTSEVTPRERPLVLVLAAHERGPGALPALDRAGRRPRRACSTASASSASSPPPTRSSSSGSRPTSTRRCTGRTNGRRAGRPRPRRRPPRPGRAARRARPGRAARSASAAATSC